MEVLIAVVALMAVVAVLSRRRPLTLLGQYIPPRTDAPILLDSAQVMKCLREAKR